MGLSAGYLTVLQEERVHGPVGYATDASATALLYRIRWPMR